MTKYNATQNKKRKIMKTKKAEKMKERKKIKKMDDI